MHSPAKPLAKIQSFNQPRPAPAAKQTLQEWHAAGGGVPTQYKGREHVWHAMVDKFAKGGEVKMDKGGDPAFYPRVGNIRPKNYKPVKPPPLIEDPRAMNLPQYGDFDLTVPTKANLDLSKRIAQRDADLKRQQQGDRSLPEKIAGVAQAGRFLGSALTQAVNSIPTRIAYGDEAADKFMQERLYKPEQPTAYEYAGDVGNFLEKLETEYKIPPVLPEATALQSVVGPAASQAKKAVGQGALSLAQSDAAYKLAQKALASPALAAVRPMNVVKPTGGNFLTGRTEKDLAPLKRNVTTRAIENGRYTPEQVAQLAESPRVQANDALNNWVDSNLTNYVKKQMGTADDPVRLMFDNRAREIDAQYAKDIEKSERIAQRATGESDPRKQANLMREAERIKAEANLERQTAVNHISHKPALLDEFLHEPLSGEQMRRAESIKKQRMEAGFPEEGLGQSPMAKAWELASDESIAAHRAGDIQGMPEKFAKFNEAENKMRLARDELDKKFKQHIAVANLNEEQEANLIRNYPFAEKAKLVGDTDYLKANEEYYANRHPMMDNYIGLGRDNPYISKLDPETQLYAPFTGDLGFDHIMDVLREDLTTGRIRPDQMNKISITDAIRRTSEYDRDLADKMNASRAAAREGLPTYREYPEGYKWIQLNKPGSFAQESEAMGHSVRGYEPPKGHPDWTEASGDAGSSGYGHGGWEAIKSGKAKVYSLVDSKGAPHATVEVKHPQEISDELRHKHKDKINDRMTDYFIDNPDATHQEALESVLARMKNDFPPSITQIKGKQNRAPSEEYLPYVQDFVKGGQWSEVGDFRNTGLIRIDPASDLATAFQRAGKTAPAYVTQDELTKLVKLKIDGGGVDFLPEGMAGGGAVRMAIGGAAAKIAQAAAAKASKKVLGAADEVPKGVEPIVVKPKVDHPLVFPRATPKTKEDIRPIAQRMAEQVTGNFVRQNPKLTTNPAGKSRKQYNREQEIPLETRRLTEEKAVPFVDYASKKGNILLGVPGDPTLGGLVKRGSLEESARPTVELTRVGDITPDSPVPLFGGPRYGDEEKFWASNYGAALPIQNNATELAKLYEAPVLGQYIKMAPGAENFAIHNLDSLLAIQQPEKLNKSNLRSLNNLIRQGSLKYGEFPGFVGFEDPIDVLLQAQLNPKLRKHIAETLTKPTITDSLGLSSGLDVVAAITHPELRNLETGVSGFSIGEMRPGSNLRQFRGAHPTYDTDIPGAAIGQSRYPIPAELAFPDTTAYARSQMTPGVQEFNMIKLLGPRERIDQQYIDEIKMYEELMKQYTGKKKGGAISKPKQLKSLSRHD